MRWKYFLCAHLVFIALGHAQAASVKDCKDALVQYTYRLNDSKFRDFRLATSIDNQTYDRLKTGVSGNGVIYGVPVGANYSNFRENIQKLSQSTSQSLTESETLNLLTTGLDGTAADAYKSCLSTIAATSGHLSLNIIGSKAKAVAVMLSWHPIGSDPFDAPLEWQTLAKAVGKLPTSAHAGDYILLMQRPSEDQDLVVSTVGYPADVTLTPLPAPPPVLKTRTISWDFIHVYSKSKSYETLAFCLPADNGGLPTELGDQIIYGIKLQEGEFIDPESFRMIGVSKTPIGAPIALDALGPAVTFKTNQVCVRVNPFGYFWDRKDYSGDAKIVWNMQVDAKRIVSQPQAVSSQADERRGVAR